MAQMGSTMLVFSVASSDDGSHSDASLVSLTKNKTKCQPSVFMKIITKYGLASPETSDFNMLINE